MADGTWTRTDGLTVEALDFDAMRPTFDRMVRVARDLFDCAGADVVIMRKDGAWRASDPLRQFPRQAPLADDIIETGQSVWVVDASLDEAFKNNHLVAGKYSRRFCAGAPIQLHTGEIIGALFVSDTAPRHYDVRLSERLLDLAGAVAQDCDRVLAFRDRDRAEADANANAALNGQFIENAPVAMVMTDRETRVMHCSSHWRQYNELEGVDVAGRTLYELFPWAASQYRAFWEKALAGETISADRVAFEASDGTTRWRQVEMSPWRDGAGEVGGLVVMSHDITNVVQALHDSELSEKRLQLANQLTQVHVWEMDYQNQTMTGDGRHDLFFDREFTFEELAADKLITVHPDDRERIWGLWQEQIRVGVSGAVEYRINRQDGREVWASQTVTLEPGPDGKIRRMIGAMQNITERKLAERAMAQALDAAEAANRAKTEFLANISHELRTPLNGVLGLSSALAATDLGPDQRKVVATIERSAKTLAALLGDILDLSQIEAGRLELKLAAFNLPDMIDQYAAMFRHDAEQKGLTLSVSVAPEAARFFEGDALRLGQILSNLLANAVKFTEAGRIDISVEAEPDCDSAWLTFAVSDTGIGFDAATAERMFNRFEQADGSLTRRHAGAGLGLSICRSLATSMDGEITASSEPGKGSTFVLGLELPYAVIELDSQTQPEPASEASAFRTPRVLVADDHATNRQVVQMILGAVGIDLVCVENGAEALERATTEAFDLILMDVQMPVMDGLTAIRRIREMEVREGRGRTTIYTLTANALPEHAAASMAAGADAHLNKPIAAAGLIAAVQHACEVVADNDSAQAQNAA
ncbi:hypothetical protein BH11PSE2_BH11PSE2_13540 [soil metagenome]